LTPLAIALALAGCWTGDPPHAPLPPPAPPPSATSASHAWRPRATVVRDVEHGCKLVVDTGCARCHMRGSDPANAKHRFQIGEQGVRDAIATHGVKYGAGVLSSDDVEDVVACMMTRWL